MWSSCLFRLFWAVTVSQTCLVLMALAVLRRPGQVFGRKFCIQTYDVFLMTGLKCSFITLYQGNVLWRSLVAALVNTGHRAEAVLVVLPHYEFLFPMCLQCVFLSRKTLCGSHTVGEGVSPPP